MNIEVFFTLNAFFMLAACLYNYMKLKQKIMKYYDGVILKNGITPATKEESVLYLEQQETKARLKRLPKHDRVSRFFHKLFKFIIPDHKKSIEDKIVKDKFAKTLKERMELNKDLVFMGISPPLTDYAAHDLEKDANNNYR